MVVCTAKIKKIVYEPVLIFYGMQEVIGSTRTLVRVCSEGKRGGVLLTFYLSSNSSHFLIAACISGFFAWTSSML
jgi:hypothetical protein